MGQKIHQRPSLLLHSLIQSPFRPVLLCFLLTHLLPEFPFLKCLTHVSLLSRIKIRFVQKRCATSKPCNKGKKTAKSWASSPEQTSFVFWDKDRDVETGMRSRWSGNKNQIFITIIESGEKLIISCRRDFSLRFLISLHPSWPSFLAWIHPERRKADVKWIRIRISGFS